MARAYVEAGASLCICARDSDKLQAAAVELRASAGAGQRVVAVAADVSEPGDVDRVAAAAFEAFERVHVLVEIAYPLVLLSPPLHSNLTGAPVQLCEKSVQSQLEGCSRSLTPHPGCGVERRARPLQ